MCHIKYSQKILSSAALVGLMDTPLDANATPEHVKQNDDAPCMTEMSLPAMSTQITECPVCEPGACFPADAAKAPAAQCQCECHWDF